MQDVPLKVQYRVAWRGHNDRLHSEVYRTLAEAKAVAGARRIANQSVALDSRVCSDWQPVEESKVGDTAKGQQ
jgi:hypothetical protein